MHVEPDGVDDEQAEYTVLGKFGNDVQGLGLQTPAGVEKLPSEHVIDNDAEGLYPMLHAGEQTDPEEIDGRQLL